jgi:hypothetical protein
MRRSRMTERTQLLVRANLIALRDASRGQTKPLRAPSVDLNADEQPHTISTAEKEPSFNRRERQVGPLTEWKEVCAGSVNTIPRMGK